MDEEALASPRAREERLERGAFYTPAALVTQVLDAVAPWCPRGAFRVVDPACGAGAFLVQAAARWPAAALLGVELEPAAAAQCRARVTRAQVLEGDALASPVLDAALPDGEGFELWLGNPPWNGTSPLLRDPAAWRRATSWMPPHLGLRRGTSLRDDFVFFLLRASARLATRRGALAFVTPATLLDAYAHAPVREALLSRLTLRAVLELPAGTFAGTKVVPCVTVWTSGEASARATQHPRPEPAAPSTPRAARASVTQHPKPERAATPPHDTAPAFTPHGPSWRLRPLPARAEALDAAWRKTGAALPDLVPVSFAGLKTRFDELLVDDDRAALEARVAAFLGTARVADFARRFGLEAFLPKLEALRAFAAGARFDAGHVRRFLRYRGPNPMGPPAWCYLDRKLIPRGDHRLRGAFDPHATPVKLVFNAHERPLAAHVLDTPGCVTMYRHTRFAPTHVPRALLDAPGSAAPEGPLVPNVTALGAAWARRLGGVRELFEHIARHVGSDDFQRHWAPAFGAAEAPLIAATRSRSAAARPTRGRAPRRGA